MPKDLENKRIKLPDVLSSEIGRIREPAHKLEEVLELRIVAYQGEGAYEANVEYAHLTVVWSRHVISD
jgi:hypothetical protein